MVAMPLKEEEMDSAKPIRIGHIGKTKGQANRVYSVKGKSVCLQSQAGGVWRKDRLIQNRFTRRYISHPKADTDRS